MWETFWGNEFLQHSCRIPDNSTLQYGAKHCTRMEKWLTTGNCKMHAWRITLTTHILGEAILAANWWVSPMQSPSSSLGELQVSTSCHLSEMLEEGSVSTTSLEVAGLMPGRGEGGDNLSEEALNFYFLLLLTVFFTFASSLNCRPTRPNKQRPTLVVVQAVVPALHTHKTAGVRYPIHWLLSNLSHGWPCNDFHAIIHF